MQEHPGQAYRALKKMGARPGDCENNGEFQVISHQKENLTLEQSTVKILRYFANISQQYSPLDVTKLPNNIQEKLGNIQSQDIPSIEAFQIFEKMKNVRILSRLCPESSRLD